MFSFSPCQISTCFRLYYPPPPPTLPPPTVHMLKYFNVAVTCPWVTTGLHRHHHRHHMGRRGDTASRPVPSDKQTWWRDWRRNPESISGNNIPPFHAPPPVHPTVTFHLEWMTQRFFLFFYYSLSFLWPGDWILPGRGAAAGHADDPRRVICSNILTSIKGTVQRFGRYANAAETMIPPVCGGVSLSSYSCSNTELIQCTVLQYPLFSRVKTCSVDCCSSRIILRWLVMSRYAVMFWSFVQTGSGNESMTWWSTTVCFCDTVRFGDLIRFRGKCWDVINGNHCCYLHHPPLVKCWRPLPDSFHIIVLCFSWRLDPWRLSLIIKLQGRRKYLQFRTSAPICSDCVYTEAVPGQCPRQGAADRREQTVLSVRSEQQCAEKFWCSRSGTTDVHVCSSSRFTNGFKRNEKGTTADRRLLTVGLTVALPHKLGTFNRPLITHWLFRCGHFLLLIIIYEAALVWLTGCSTPAPPSRLPQLDLPDQLQMKNKEGSGRGRGGGGGRRGGPCPCGDVICLSCSHDSAWNMLDPVWGDVRWRAEMFGPRRMKRMKRRRRRMKDQGEGRQWILKISCWVSNRSFHWVQQNLGSASTPLRTTLYWLGSTRCWKRSSEALKLEQHEVVSTWWALTHLHFTKSLGCIKD